MEQNERRNLTRRAAIERLGLLAGGALSLPMLSGLAAGCRATGPANGVALRVLSDDQFQLVSAFVEVIIPTTDTPGAIAAGVPGFVDQMLSDWYPEADKNAILGGLDAINARAANDYGVGFADASNEQQVELVQQSADAKGTGSTEDGKLNNVFRALKELTVVGYYTSEIGATQELRQMPMGAYLSDVPYSDIGRAWS